jgi:hypothetical protein
MQCIECKERPVICYNRGLCNRCYLKLRKKGLLKPLTKVFHRKVSCKAKGCNTPISIRNKSGLCIKCYRKDERERNKGKHILLKRKYHLKAFGLTPEKFKEILEKQNNCCAICGEVYNSHDPRLERLRNMHIDHDSQTGRVRGILCSFCNTALGHFKHDFNSLNSAIKYLEKRDSKIEGAKS